MSIFPNPATGLDGCVPRRGGGVWLVAAVLLLATPALAATQAEAEARFTAAKAEEAKALAAKAAWTPTEAALKDAEKSLAAKDWDTAKAAADEALALATRSLAQSHEQKTLWQDAVIR